MVIATVFHGRKIINEIHSDTTASKEHHLSNVFHPVSTKVSLKVGLQWSTA
jgi:hypothetical protein